MSKLRSDSQWNQLSEEQRDTLESWLFDENISYRDAIERLQKEFGITAPLSSLARLYQQLAKARMQAELLQVKRTAEELQREPVDLEELNAAAIRLVSKRMIQLAIESPGKIKELATLARILINNEAVEVKKMYGRIAWDKYEVELMDEEFKIEREIKDMQELKNLQAKFLGKETAPSQPKAPDNADPASGAQPS